MTGVIMHGPISEGGLVKTEYNNPVIRETLGFLFQNVRFVKTEKAGQLKPVSKVTNT